MYTRADELRHLRSNDVYQLFAMLDDNDGWKKLVEVIPKELNARACSADEELNWEQAMATAGPKYKNDHIRLIESAHKRTGETRFLSEILFDEWGTSGRKHERPTVGVLLQLLVQAELFRAADHVAIHFLGEPPPARPLNGPAARVDITISDEIFDDINDLMNDSSYFPGTESINDNVNDSARHNNKDFYTKYQRQEKQIDAPIPPPRAQRTARLQLQQQQSDGVTSHSDNSSARPQPSFENSHNTQNIPKFSELMTNESTMQSANTESTNLSEAPIPMISALTEHSTNTVFTGADSATQAARELDYPMTDNHKILPLISALNLNGERDTSTVQPSEETAAPSSSTRPISGGDDSSSSSLSNDSVDEDIEHVSARMNVGQTEDNDGDEEDVDEEDEDDDDNSMPNLSIFEQRSSNNDSSLTNVTGTSGENSFDLSMNEGSSASNENIPCVSALQK